MLIRLKLKQKIRIPNASILCIFSLLTTVLQIYIISCLGTNIVVFLKINYAIFFAYCDPINQAYEDRIATDDFVQCRVGRGSLRIICSFIQSAGPLLSFLLLFIRAG